MLRPLAIVMALACLGTGCTLDVDGIRKGAEELKKDVESSNLKDCKDENGKPLPKWVCRKDEDAAAEAAN
ncbi:MAG: hypothetical protein ISQ52_02660 [Synechococcus sp. BS307-5m-G38]|nr:hypothetical protein [Synechococcus sp. BS307-5m-G38]